MVLGANSICVVRQLHMSLPSAPSQELGFYWYNLLTIAPVKLSDNVIVQNFLSLNLLTLNICQLLFFY